MPNPKVGDMVRFFTMGRPRDGLVVRITQSLIYVAWESPSSGVVRVKGTKAVIAVYDAEQAAGVLAPLKGKLEREYLRLRSQVRRYTVGRWDQEQERSLWITATAPALTWSPVIGPGRREPKLFDRKTADKVAGALDPRLEARVHFHSNGEPV